ncbi:MAG: immunoglobulin domain-containing protein [Opitutales bacterium]|nr:immunoglobulin domain-containing protein [Opitutales bacterium]
MKLSRLAFRTLLILPGFFAALPAQEPYDIITSSWMGGAQGDEVRGMRIAPDGSIYVVAQVQGELPWAGTPALLAGATESSQGVYLHLDATGRTVLAYVRVADEVFHLDTDAAGHPYIGSGSGLIKLDPADTSVLWMARPDLEFRDVDVAPSGLVAARQTSNTHIFNADGSNERIISNYRRTFDIALDEGRQVLYQIGWRQSNSGCNPVQIAYLRAVDFEGNVLWLNYDWPAPILEPDCTGPYDRPFTNLMADTRGYRVHLGLDGYLYGAYEAAGGNHIFLRAAAWDPNNDNLLVPAPLVRGDMFHHFFNTGAEHKTVVVGYDPDTGEHLTGQEFLTRFWTGSAYAGNGWRIRDGELAVDADGRLFMVGATASGMPIEGFQGYSPSPGEATFNPWADEAVYTGGAYLIIMDPTLSIREFTTRLSGGNAAAVTVDFRDGLNRPTVAWGGWTGSFRVDGEGGGGIQETRLYTINAPQPEPGDPDNPAGAFFAVGSYERPEPPPTVTLDAPAEGDFFFVGDSVTFAGSAVDWTNTPLDPALLVWSSDLDGTLGTGTFLEVDTLSTGAHTISLTATGDGGSRTVTVGIDIYPPPAPPAIVEQPKDTEAFRGGAAVFSVAATGSPPLFDYQWFKGDEPLADGGRVSGAATAQLTISGLEADDAGSYRVEVTNTEGTAESAEAQLTVLEPVAPSILADPVGGRFRVDAVAELSVEVAGSDPIAFQWRRDGADLSDDDVLSGTQSDRLVIDGIRLSDTGSYDVVVTNLGGTAVSAPVFVEAFIPPPPDAVLAEWNFNHFESTTTTNGFGEMIDADVGTGTLFVQSATTTGTNFRRDTGGGTDLNASEGTPAGGSIELRRGERWNNGYLEFRFDMTGYETAVISFAYETRSTLPGTATVEWSADGGETYSEYTVLETADYGSLTRIELDFEGISELAGAADARLRLRYSADGGAGSSGLGARFDNVRIEVWAPAGATPGTYAAWRIERFGGMDDPAGAPQVDPLQRGIPNAVEYALGLDFLEDVRAGMPGLSGDFQLAFTRRADSAARLIIETSSTLGAEDWTPAATLEPGAASWTGPALVEETGTGDIRHVLVTHPSGPPTVGGPRFMRLRVGIGE